jgi:hypothetical protein
MKIMNILKNRSFAACLVAVLCVSLLTPRKADAGLVEYPFILALIEILVIIVPEGTPGGVVGNQLLTAVEGAALANSEGNRPKEISRLGKVIGLAEALMGITSSCGDACGALRGDLQQVIGIAANLKSLALGVVASCHPNGVIQGNEQCDPLAVPTGCPVLILPSFCSDECQCVLTP